MTRQRSEQDFKMPDEAATVWRLLLSELVPGWCPSSAWGLGRRVGRVIRWRREAHAADPAGPRPLLAAHAHRPPRATSTSGSADKIGTNCGSGSEAPNQIFAMDGNLRAWDTKPASDAALCVVVAGAAAAWVTLAKLPMLTGWAKEAAARGPAPSTNTEPPVTTPRATQRLLLVRLVESNSQLRLISPPLSGMPDTSPRGRTAACRMDPTKSDGTLSRAVNGRNLACR